MRNRPLPLISFRHVYGRCRLEVGPLPISTYLPKFTKYVQLTVFTCGLGMFQGGFSMRSVRAPDEISFSSSIQSDRIL